MLHSGALHRASQKLFQEKLSSLFFLNELELASKVAYITIVTGPIAIDFGNRRFKLRTP